MGEESISGTEWMDFKRFANANLEILKLKISL